MSQPTETPRKINDETCYRLIDKAFTMMDKTREAITELKVALEFKEPKRVEAAFTALEQLVT